MPYTVGSQLVECQHDGCQSKTSNCHPVCPIHATCWYTDTFVISSCKICTSLLVTTLDINSHHLQRTQAIKNLFEWIAILTEVVRHRKVAFNINIELKCLTKQSYLDISSEEWSNLLQLLIMHGTMSQFLPDGRSRDMASFPSCGLYDLSSIFQMRDQKDIHLNWDPKWEVPRSFRFRLGYPINTDLPQTSPSQNIQTQIQSRETNPEQFQPCIWYSGDNYPLVNYEESLSESKTQTNESVHKESSETRVLSCGYRFHPLPKFNSGGLKQDTPESDNFNTIRLKHTLTGIDTPNQGPSTFTEDKDIHYYGWRHLPQDAIIIQNEADEVIGFKDTASGKEYVKDIVIKKVNDIMFFRYKTIETSISAETAGTVASCSTALTHLSNIFPSFGMDKDVETLEYPASKFVYQALQMEYINCDLWSKDRYLAWLDTGRLNIVEMPVFIIAIQNEGLSSLKQCLLEPVLKSNIANLQFCSDRKLLNKSLLISDYEARMSLWDILSNQRVDKYVSSCMSELQSLHTSYKTNIAVQTVTEVIHERIYQMALLARQAMIKFFTARKSLRDEALEDRNLTDSNVKSLTESSPCCQFLFPETVIEELITKVESLTDPSGVYAPLGCKSRGSTKGKGK